MQSSLLTSKTQASDSEDLFTQDGTALTEEEEAIVREEEALLARVLGHLTTVRPSRPPPVMDYDEQLISLRDQIASARLEDVPALVQQMERLQGIAARRNESIVEPVDPKSPYFGHLRLREKERGERDVLIGRTTHVDARAGVRIVDWRHAPVSQIYYRYEEGSDYEETFGERDVEGTVLVRRTVTIDSGKLCRIATSRRTLVRAESGWRAISSRTTELAGGQGKALRPEDMRELVWAQGQGTLGVGATFQAREDRHLPEIAALLDPRQFELISKPDTGIVVIQGGAGSGKTTIGVHRMAFLAHVNSRRFSADKMLVIVGSPALRAYISEVLPALRLGEIAVETFEEWARATRLRAFPWLAAPIEENTPSVVTRYKTHPALLHLLEKRAVELQHDDSVRRDSHGVLWFWADVLTDLDRVLEAFRAANDPDFGPEQVKRAWRWCADRCPAVLELDPGDRAERKAAMADEPEEGEDDDDEALQDATSDDRAVLDPEDDALLLRSYQLLRGELRKGKGPLLYEHLFVDEAQDLAPIDLAVLLGVVTKQRSVTLAGDTAQRIHLDSGFRDWRVTLDDLNLSSVDVEPLRIGYRSTKQVMALARAVLGPLADPNPPIASRSGAPVEHHHFPSAGAAVAFLAGAIRPLFSREPRATLAILARHPDQADVYYEALKMAEVPSLRRVRAYEFSFRPGVEVTEIRQVKGLEFDYVVLVDVNASSFPEDDLSRHLLHIGATRAAHQLWIISTGPPSPLLPKALG